MSAPVQDLVVGGCYRYVYRPVTRPGVPLHPLRQAMSGKIVQLTKIIDASYGRTGFYQPYQFRTDDGFEGAAYHSELEDLEEEEFARAATLFNSDVMVKLKKIPEAPEGTPITPEECFRVLGVPLEAYDIAVVRVAMRTAAIREIIHADQERQRTLGDGFHWLSGEMIQALEHGLPSATVALQTTAEARGHAASLREAGRAAAGEEGATEITLRVAFELDNGRFPGEVQLEEVVRILRKMVYRVEGGQIDGVINDANGKAVGSWRLRSKGV